MATQAKILSFDDARKSSSRTRAAGGSVRREERASSRSSRSAASRDQIRESRRSNRAGQEQFRAASVSAKGTSAMPSWFESSFAASNAPSRFADPDPFERSSQGRHAAQDPRINSRGAHSAVMSYDDFLEEEQENSASSSSQKGRSSKKKSPFTKFADWRRKHTKDKADKQFTRQFGGDSADAGAAGPRAAVYKGQMGSSQRRANRMQSGGSVASSGKSSGMRAARKAGADGAKQGGGFSVGALFGAIGSGITGLFSSTKRVVALTAVACVVVACSFMYPAAKQYYTELRSYQQVQAEYDAVVARNELLAEQRDYLNSVEGIEQTAHDNYGWVNKGENAVLVYGLRGDDELPETNLYVTSGSVPAPETWYSVILDPFFGFTN